MREAWEGARVKARHHVTTLAHAPHLFAVIGPQLPPERCEDGVLRRPTASYLAMVDPVLPGVASATIAPLGIGDAPESTLLDY